MKTLDKISLRIYASTNKDDVVQGKRNGKKRPLNLSVNGELAGRVISYLAENKRKGRRNVSELTEQLWITYLRRKGVKLPESVLLKEAA